MPSIVQKPPLANETCSHFSDTTVRAAGDARQQQGTTTTTRASTSPDSAAALSSGSNKRERGELERTGAGSDEEDGAGGRKKMRLSKDQAALLEECFKTHSTLNPVSSSQRRCC
jgi:homeobox-leucine zipper protein